MLDSIFPNPSKLGDVRSNQPCVRAENVTKMATHVRSHLVVTDQILGQLETINCILL